MPPDLITQLITMAPAVVVLMWVVVRLERTSAAKERRIDALIKALIDCYKEPEE